MTIITAQDSFLTVAEVAAALRVSRMTVYGWIRDGRLPASRLAGTTLRVRASDFDRFLFEGATDAGGARARAGPP